MKREKREIKTEELTDLLECSVDDAPFATVRGATEDSGRVSSGSIFVAVVGEQVDGHSFVAQAREKGAIAVIGERADISRLEGLPYIRVPHSRRALGLLAHRLAGDPTLDFPVIGITGTNGKTSTAHLIESVLRASGHRTANFGTIEYRVGDKAWPAPHTTPVTEELVEMFVRARDANTDYAVMEVSSHALEQERVAGIHYSVGVFTNLTQDHLDYHNTLDEYLDAKLKLFALVDDENGFTVVNADDAVAGRFIEASKGKCITVGTSGDCRAEDIELGMHGTRFKAETPWGRATFNTKLIGKHNVSNTLSAIAVCGGIGLSLDAIETGIATSSGAPGRFERIDEGQDFQVIVDYAHTDDGLKNVLQAARAICKGRVIVVFGCGGDRDKTKRPKMAQAAARLADFSIITSDNPRTEAPERILLDTEVGMQRNGKRKGVHYEVIEDRAEAIERGIAIARPGDLVLIAGKGHEDYQIIGTERIHFDDRETARAIIEKVSTR